MIVWLALFTAAERGALFGYKVFVYGIKYFARKAAFGFYEKWRNNVHGMSVFAALEA